ncbi:MAG: hypothetical protein SH856_08915 [Flavobacteriales bacterium]|nr:hypothetical protein [Flavobacteriales bacterium]
MNKNKIKNRKIQPQKRQLNMKAIIIVLLVCVGAGLGAAHYLKKDEQEVQKAKPILGVPIPKMKTLEDVKQYGRDVMAQPVPRDYKFPDYILNAVNYDEAMMELNKRYPNFSQKEGVELLNAIWAHPLEHQQMICENKAARIQFNPELRFDPKYGGQTQ